MLKQHLEALMWQAGHCSHRVLLLAAILLVHTDPKSHHRIRVLGTVMPAGRRWELWFEGWEERQGGVRRASPYSLFPLSVE